MPKWVGSWHWVPTSDASGKHPSIQTGIVIAIAIVTVTEIVTATAADEVGGG